MTRVKNKWDSLMASGLRGGSGWPGPVKLDGTMGFRSKVPGMMTIMKIHIPQGIATHQGLEHEEWGIY